MSYVFRKFVNLSSSKNFMQKHILHKAFTRIFCLIFLSAFISCQQVEITSLNQFFLSSLPHIQQFERQDHSFCSSLKIDFDKSEITTSQNYWRCRLSLAKYRLKTDKLPDSERHNLEISDLVTKISLKISQSSESILIHENNKLDNRHHQQCLEMGYEIATTDQVKIDDYFACRFVLVNKYQDEPPYGNEEYTKYPNRSYNTTFVIDRRIQKDIELYLKEKEKYPTCVKFNLYSEDFRRCKNAQDASEKCFSQIEKKKFLKEWEEKIACQKAAYSEFPDNFLKPDDKELEDAKRINSNSDFYNQNSFAALGIDANQFSAEALKEKTPEEKEEEEVKKNKELRAEINSKNKLYNKFELTKLRKRYIFACQKEADVRVSNYVANLKDSCEELKKFKTTDED